MVTGTTLCYLMVGEVAQLIYAQTLSSLCEAILSLWLLSFIPSSPHPQPVSVHFRTPDMGGGKSCAGVDDR